MPGFDPKRAYESGLVGCFNDPAVRKRFQDFITSQGQSPNGRVCCDRYGLTGTGEGKLWAPFAIIEKVFPGSLPASAQQVGSCVAHNTRNAILGTISCEIYAGKPDEVSGLIEVAPEVSDAGRRDGVFSTESLYWHRNHAGQDGWQCEEAAEIACKTSGAVVRKNYPEIGIDLTTYDVKTEVKWGRPFPPENVEKVVGEHLIRTATQADTFEQVRDLLANGFCLSSCGGESFSDQRGEDGVAERTPQGWGHAMAILGVDDRDEVKRKYGGPLLMVMNSWGPSWNRGSRKVLGVDLEIPEGSFWAKWSDVKNRTFIALSGANGWPAKKLPNWTGSVL